MSDERIYPDESVGEFPDPPRLFVDDSDREIQLRAADATDRTGLLEMYLEFDPEDRAQGIPPIDEHAIEQWLDNVIDEDCLGVVARHDDQAVGHAMLVPDREGNHELAIFVLGAYQSAGIGTELVRTLVGLAQVEGLDRVWLTVERWNDAAISLYRKVGFEVCSTESFEMEMSIRLLD
jgi:ribosomal protein S18 acetylase RimI-like enzyme